MFVVQLTNTSLSADHQQPSSLVSLVQLTVLLLGLTVLVTIALTNYDLIHTISSFNLDSLSTNDTYVTSLQDTASLTTDTHTLGYLASSIFNEYGYLLVLSAHAIVLAVIGPIKLALSP